MKFGKKKEKKSSAEDDDANDIAEAEQDEPQASVEIEEDDILEGHESEAEAEDKEKAEKEEQNEKKKNREQIIETPAKLEDIKKLQIRRLGLEKLIDEPYFDQFVKGMFCRVTIGSRKDGSPAYRLCEITGIQDYKRPYHFANQKIKKALLLKHGKSGRVFMMLTVSNSSITSGDFERWLKEMKRCQLPIISREEVTRLCRERKSFT